MSSSLTATFILTNEPQERARFFADHAYNPQLEYSQPPDPAWLTKYPQVSPELLETAQRILQETMTEYGSLAAARAREGALVPEVEVRARIAEYLALQKIDHELDVRFSPQFMARTGVNAENGRCLLKIKLPMLYQADSFQDVLDHEIGTHVFRWLNEFQQPWHNRRQDFQLADHVETEEGLAILHSHLSHPVAQMWVPSLYVVAVDYAQSHSFRQVFEHLQTIIQDDDQSWRLTIRAKRGLRDTSQPGGYRKDALYLRGAQIVGRWLTQPDSRPALLYAGKLALADCLRLAATSQIPGLRLPSFVSLLDYQERIARTMEINHL